MPVFSTSRPWCFGAMFANRHQMLTYLTAKGLTDA